MTSITFSNHSEGQRTSMARIGRMVWMLAIVMLCGLTIQATRDWQKALQVNTVPTVTVDPAQG